MVSAPVSVIIPTYNSASLVTEAIDSVLAQTVPPAEIVVVDDGSRDDTRGRLAPFGNRIRYHYQANQGVAVARNNGVRAAHGEWIGFLDADDVWHPRKLEMQCLGLAARPDLALLGTAMFDWPADDFPSLDPVAGRTIDDITLEELAVKNHLATSTIIARRDLLERAGGFDPSLRGPEDYDLWLRVAEFARVANLRAPLTGYRQVPGSLSKQLTRMEADMWRVFDKLDERRVWRGRRLLRSKAHSYCDYSCALMQAAAGRTPQALMRLFRSFLWYPFPYRRREAEIPLARSKVLAVLALRMLRLKKTPS